ncbi:TonB-dependent receptor [Chondrinema litorale]|uniref:TonB-dependent receptor n=1 Tax=Chondrinema litorale TaxID=2994555 RepID=UPI002543826A|nr:TonB-dependent receptor [Chondrinema litorale]UZR94830.1 TonB-dependent receptor [Chondrinema litorale]
MNIKIRIGLTTFLMFIAVLQGMAQQEWEEGGDLNDARLLIEKESVLELPTKPKQLDKMEKIERERSTAPQQYSLNPLVLDLPGIMPELDAAELRKPAEDYLQPVDGYFKAGLGNYFTTYLEGHYYGGDEGIFQYGGNVKHLSSQRGPIDKENSANSYNSIDLSGKYFLTGGILKGNIGYERNAVHFYGYDTIPLAADFDADNIKQVYNVFDIGTSFMNDDPLADIHYEAGVDFYALSDNYEASETNLNLHGKGKYEFSDESFVDVNANLIFASKNDSAKVNRNLFLMGAAYHYQYDQFNITAGVKIAYNGDSTFVKNRFRIYPDIHAKYGLIEDKVALYGRLTGGLEQVTLRSLSRENPFIGPNVALAHTDKQIELAAGVETAPNGKLGFKAEAGYSSIKNLYYFINSDADQSKFDVFYENSGVGVLNLKVEASAEIGPVRAVYTTNYYNYGTDSLDAPFHRPSLLNTLSASYNHQNKLFVNLDLYHISGLQAREPVTGNTIDLDGIIDLNLKADYVINSNFSAFMALNNIISKKYERYLYYDRKGINVLLGVTYRLNSFGF